MKESILTVTENRILCKDVYLLKLQGDTPAMRAGRFVEVALSGFTLRRPFGVADSQNGELTLLYKITGQGTRRMTALEKGDVLNVLTDLGNGFRLEKSRQPLLIGGGIGAAPLYQLAKDLKKQGKKPFILLGFRTKDEVFYEKEYSQWGDLAITTDDGSYGFKGNAASYLMQNPTACDYYYACGPLPMLKALQVLPLQGELSLEARMGCGFGACMGCSIKTTDGGYRRVCKEGPVFTASEVIL